MKVSPRTLWPLAAAGLLAVVVGASVVGSVIPEPRPAPNVAPTEPPAAQALATTPTPTPRVIEIPGNMNLSTPAPTPPPTSPPTAAAALPTAATRDPAVPSPTLPTPREITSAPAATTVPAADPQPPTPAPPTATSPPAPTLSPTLPPAPTATPAPARAQPVNIEFAAEDWSGGYYRGDSRAYGRPWTAVYGAFSEYPRATLTFTLDATPADSASLIVTGLDDEWAALNEIAVEVNGQVIFRGTAPFANWDGIGDGSGAVWMMVSFSLPGELLRTGENEIAIANLTQSGNFDAPPYLLLAEATLQLEGLAASGARQGTDTEARDDDQDQRDGAQAGKSKKKSDKHKSKNKKSKRGKDRKK